MDSCSFVATIVTAITSIVGTLVVQYTISRFAHHDSKADLHSENRSLKHEVSELQSKNQKLEAQVLELKKQIADKFGREAILAKYRFEQSTGTYVLNDLHYCHKCLHGTPQIESPLLKTDLQFSCSCGSVYRRKPIGPIGAAFN